MQFATLDGVWPAIQEPHERCALVVLPAGREGVGARRWSVVFRTLIPRASWPPNGTDCLLQNWPGPRPGPRMAREGARTLSSPLNCASGITEKRCWMEAASDELGVWFLFRRARSSTAGRIVELAATCTELAAASSAGFVATTQTGKGIGCSSRLHRRKVVPAASQRLPSPPSDCREGMTTMILRPLSIAMTSRLDSRVSHRFDRLGDAQRLLRAFSEASAKSLPQFFACRC